MKISMKAIFLSSFFAFKQNFFPVTRVAGADLCDRKFVLLVFIFIGIVTLVWWIFRRGHGRKKIFLMILTAVVIFSSAQFSFQMDILWHDYVRYQHLSVHQRYWDGADFPYLFAIETRSKLPKGRYVAQYLSDQNLNVDPGAFTYRAIAYFLYPQINIRSKAGHETINSYVFIDKHDAQQMIATKKKEGFRTIYEFDNKSLVAVKDEVQ